MSSWEKCNDCPLQVWGGRCSFNRLIGEAVLRNLVTDYIETPSYIQIVGPGLSLFCDPEEAHDLLCNILRSAVLHPGTAEEPVAVCAVA